MVLKNLYLFETYDDDSIYDWWFYQKCNPCLIYPFDQLNLETWIPQCLIKNSTKRLIKKSNSKIGGPKQIYNYLFIYAYHE